MKRFSKYFDHTMLRADATAADIRILCAEAAEYDLAAVCVNGCHVAAAAEILRDTDIKVSAVAGFPLGAMSSAAKLAETRDALDCGADEIDVVMNIGALREGNTALVTEEIAALSRLCHEQGSLLKVIIETCLLSEEEITAACELSCRAGADFIKTCTGFSSGGARAEDVKLMKAAAAGRAEIKASGGIRTLSDAEKMIAAGADRLGCSASVKIMKEYSDTE